ncbi:MAG TPA: acyl carrier protein [Xanthobacteraceae bacterium]|nr:acyl carrier protein [Xanthobacteraceae bacterium]
MENLDAAELNIRRWCTDYLAETLKLPPSRIDPQTKFARLGMDSAMSVFFLVALEDWLGVELGSDVVFDHPTVAELARHVAGRFPQAAASAVGK